MATSLFRTLEKEAMSAGINSRTAQSRDWFRDKVKELGQINRHNLLKDPSLEIRQRFRTGSMFMFFYDPKHRETLPYYDAFPLTIMIEPAPKGFYGLNLHYLAPKPRALFLDKLMETTNNNRFDETTRFKIRYELLSSVRKLKEFRPCFKHYLTEHVNSRIVMVEPRDWEAAIFLPVEQFRKQKKNIVWKESKRMTMS